MRIFSINQKINNGVRTTESINCQLTSDDILVIKSALENHKKFENTVMESCRNSIVESFKSENL